MNPIYIGFGAGVKAASDFRLPLDVVTQTIAILAKRGVGKSYTASVIAEELLDHGQQVVVVDPTGAWFGLRSSADGKHDGYPIVVIGGDHGDIPLDEHAGELLATAIVERRFSAVLDLSLLRKGQAVRLMTAFAETLYRKNREPVHLIVDEADAVAPQRPMADEARMLGAMEDIVRRGRKRGIGCTLITQRPAVLNKNVLTQCEMLVALRLVHPRDIGAVMEWVNVHADPAQAKSMMDGLPSLPVGTAWFWAPGWGDLFECVRVRTRKTFDSGATPKPGEHVKAPARITQVDVEALGRDIAALAEQAKANDPVALKAKVEALKRELAKPQPPMPITPAPVNVPVFSPADLDNLSKLRETLEKLKDNYYKAEDSLLRCWETLNELNARAAAATAAPRHLATPAPSSRPVAAPRPPAPKPDMDTSSGLVVGKAHRTILSVLSIYRGSSCPKGKLAIMAGYAVGGGGFNNALSALCARGYVERRGNEYAITALAETLGHVDMGQLPRGAGLREYWLSQLGKAECEILTVLIEAYPMALPKDEAATRTASQYASTGGGFNNALSRLRTLGLVEGRGDLRATAELMEG